MFEAAPPLVCFDIGGSFIRYGRAAGTVRPTTMGRFSTPAGDFDAFVAALRAGIAATGARSAALSIAGVVDPATGIADVANIACLRKRPLAADLERALGLPVHIANDADCFALAEAHEGAGRHGRVVLAIILGSGVGGGVVVDGRLLPARAGISGEWGHGPCLDPTAGGLAPELDAFECGCGRTGCLDAIGSARGMERIHQRLHGQKATSRDICDGGKAADARASRTLDVWARIVARSLSVIVNTLGPDTVPVGGGLSGEQALIDRLNGALAPLVLARPKQPLLVAGHHRRDGGLIGAAIAARLAGGGVRGARWSGAGARP